MVVVRGAMLLDKSRGVLWGGESVRWGRGGGGIWKGVYGMEMHNDQGGVLIYRWGAIG